MDRKFTHQETMEFFSIIDNEDMKELNPGKRVIFLVRQLAYSYHAEKKLPQTLNAIILN
jgi:cold shock CspA family protein